MVRMPSQGAPVVDPEIELDAGVCIEDAPLENVGRRAAPRLRLSIPARLVTTTATHRCVLLDVSRLGAQISLERPLAEGEAGLLNFAGFEVFACVIRTGPGLNGVEFDGELSDEDVLQIRQYAEHYETDERAALKEEARAWVTGGR